MILAVGPVASFNGSGKVGAGVTRFRMVEVEMERKTVLPPLGSNAVALTSTGIYVVAVGSVTFVASSKAESRARMGKIAEDDGVSGQTVAIGICTTVVWKT